MELLKESFKEGELNVLATFMSYELPVSISITVLSFGQACDSSGNSTKPRRHPLTNDTTPVCVPFPERAAHYLQLSTPR